MKVVCMINNLNKLTNERVVNRLRRYIFLSDGEINLEIGKEYTVYGIVFRDNSPWYYLCNELHDEHPIPYAAEFFRISDNRLSSYWRLSVDYRNPDEVFSSLLFDEWAQENPLFYEHLLDGYPKAVGLFMKYRRVMDQE